MTFTVTDQAALGKIFAAAKAGDWQSAYQEVLNAITVQEELVSADGWTSYVDRPATADIEGVWVWVNGAKKVNAGTGTFAEYIRKYTATQ